MSKIDPLVIKLLEQLPSVEKELADVSASGDMQKIEALSREHRRLSGLKNDWERLEECRQQLADNQEMLQAEEDEEFRQVIESDVENLKEELKKLETRVMILVLPPGENDSRNTIVEIRPAAGGDEASLFAADLYRMYTRFADQMKWKTEVIDITETNLGGIKDISFSVQGEEVFRYLAFESGVHRVQRVPSTETSGRIHTSTVTVAVLPEANEVEIDISPEDLDIKTTRSSGPGGQSVNTTDSAVVITHIPTGITVQCQNEKSQHKNKAQAMRVLRSRLLEAKQREEQEKYAAQRKSQVGTGDRSERIRTYNYPQNRVSDHRFNLSWFHLPEMLEGDLGPMFEDLLATSSQNRLDDELASLQE